MADSLKPEDWRTSTPIELLAYAKKTMLDGRAPQNDEDWQMVANYIAFNVEKGAERDTLSLMSLLIPLSEEVLMEIADYQRLNPEKLSV